MVSGKEIGANVYPAPVIVTAETTRSAFPVLLTITVFVLVVPTVTFPNDKLVGFRETAGAPEEPPLALLVTPVLPHPANKSRIIPNPITSSICPGWRMFLRSVFKSLSPQAVA
jgi:hypothetical protein